mgnify:CR=1 FL=1
MRGTNIGSLNYRRKSSGGRRNSNEIIYHNRRHDGTWIVYLFLRPNFGLFLFYRCWRRVRGKNRGMEACPFQNWSSSRESCGTKRLKMRTLLDGCIEFLNTPILVLVHVKGYSFCRIDFPLSLLFPFNLLFFNSRGR